MSIFAFICQLSQNAFTKLVVGVYKASNMQQQCYLRLRKCQFRSGDRKPGHCLAFLCLVLHIKFYRCHGSSSLWFTQGPHGDRSTNQK